MYDLVTEIVEQTKESRYDYVEYTGWILPNGSIEETGDGHLDITYQSLQSEFNIKAHDSFVAFWIYIALKKYVRFNLTSSELAGKELSFDICNRITSKQLKTLMSLINQTDSLHYEFGRLDTSKVDDYTKLDNERQFVLVSGDTKEQFMSDIRKHKMVKSDVMESIIDYPRPNLSPEIWDKVDDSYRLRDDVKQKIVSSLEKYPNVQLMGIGSEYHITGSIGTNQYSDDADIDIHIIPIEGSEYANTSFQRDVFKWFKRNRDDIDAYVGSHPIEVYVQLNPAQEYLSDAVYEFMEDRWIKGPTIAPPEFDPYEEYKDLMDDIRSESEEADKMLGELKRDTIDYEIIRSAVEGMTIEQKKALESKLKSKIQEIQYDIEELLKLKKDWTDARKLSSQPSTPEEALQDVELTKTWRDKNATFKFLNRYNYMRMISDLEKMIEDDKLSREEVSVIGGMLGIK